MGKRGLKAFVVQDDLVDETAQQRFGAQGLFGFFGDAVPDRIKLSHLKVGLCHGVPPVSPHF